MASPIAWERGFPAPLCSPHCAPVFEPVDLPIWKELGWPLTWLGLRLSPVYHGSVKARGHGGPVIVVPGFLASDLHHADLRLWLARVGYEPVASDIGRNADCPDVLLDRLLETIDGTYRRTGRPVQLVGHSFGGVLARGAAQRRPRQVSHVITLASPFRALRAHRWVLEAASRLSNVLPPPSASPRPHKDHTHAGDCACEFLREDSSEWPHEIRRTAVYTRDDGVVDWRACIEDDPALNVEVHGSHVGLLFNAEVYVLLSQLLPFGEDESTEGQGHEAAMGP